MATRQRAQVGESVFARLLRHYRLAAGLSQEALAERAGLSDRAISALERGVNRAPWPDTVTRLAAALALTDEQRAAFRAAARPTPTPPPVEPSPPRATPPAAPRHNLPAPPTPLVGREHAVALLLARLREPGSRLLTLTGMGGVGKTRLALEVAHAALADFPDGVWLVSLAPLTDPALVAGAIAQAVGVREIGGRSLREQVVDQLRPAQLLLLLDNFEHLLPAAPLVGELLAACPRLWVLVTSRAALHLRGEQQVPVPPLALPDESAHPPSLESLERVAAVALFVQRARAAQPTFALTAANAAAVAGICRRLDGLPLAIELAAARVRLLPPAALLQRLARRLPLLKSKAPDLPSRQQTLHDTIAWSYDLLDADEQRLFRRLAIFAGGSTIEAAEAVCAEEAAHGAIALVDGLASLVNKSLLRQEEQVDPLTGTPEPRLLMLETVREFGLDRLAAGGELEALHRRHAAFFLGLVEEAAPRLRGPEQRAWRERLDREADNLLATLRWTLASEEAQLGLRLASSLWYFWMTRGHLSEGRRWLESLLACVEPRGQPVSPDVRARALLWAATFATEQGDYGRALALCDESDALCKAWGDTWGLAWSLNVRGELARHRGDPGGAIALFERSLALFRSLDERWYVAMVLNNLGALARYQADNARATALYEESLAMTREIGDTWSIAMILGNLGEVARDQGDTERAAALCEESLGLFRLLGDQRGAAFALTYLGVVARERGEHQRAWALYAESLALWQQVGQRSEIATCLEGLADATCAQGGTTFAARLLGSAAALRDRIGAPVLLADRPEYERTVTSVRAALGPAFLAVWEAGQAMALEQVVDEALTAEGMAGPAPVGSR